MLRIPPSPWHAPAENDRHRPEDPVNDSPVQRAAGLIAAADGLIVAAGAGMGVDSGLPDFRGPEGFWQAYPALGRARLSFVDVANPRTFLTNPRLAWGFYGHRLNLYRRTEPHAGFAILRRIAARLPMGAFVYTSNVDGQFQKAGFDPLRIVEAHGSIHVLQCLEGCLADVWPTGDFAPEIDAGECRCLSALPACPHCGGLARPNILMFDDWGWLRKRTAAQRSMYDEWRARVPAPVLIEIGAGTRVPTIRRFSDFQRCPLIRLNPHEPGARSGGIEIAAGALDGLRRIEAALVNDGFLTEEDKP
jgi:NAD-dependent SIR2 family protein deacetylase